MALFEWTDKFSVGVRQLDKQHQKLFFLINGMYESMSKGEGKKAVERVIENLLEYTQTHFAEEEGLMEKHGYPEYPSHRQEHLELIARVMQFQKDFLDGNAFLSVQILNFLRDWLSNHIMKTDMKYSAFFKGKGVV